jgi:phosphatidylserine decarboxylase
MEEAARSIGDFRSFDALFTRELRPGLRTWETGRDVLASPVDGVVGEFGIVEDGRLVQAKGRHYTVGALLADESAAARYDGGLFFTIYLSPRHYHRIHTPIPGRVVSARHVPGRLFPVHPAAVREVAHLFARNERLLCIVDSDVGPVAVVAVGAMNVGRISAAFDPAWAGGPDEGVTNRGGARISERTYDAPPEVSRGDQLMAFHLGSTVVLLAPPGLRPASDIGPGLEVEVGRTLARAIPSN